MHSCICGALLACGTPVFAQTQAQTAPSAAADPRQIREELDRLRREFDAIRDAYGARLTALEAKLGGTTPAAAPVPAAVPATPVETPLQAAPTAPLPSYNPSALSKIFNPDMAVVGNFLGAAGKNTVDPRSSLRLDEAEATFQAVVDPHARADFFMAFTPEGVEIEEGFITLTSLPGGQYRRTQYADGPVANELLFQLLFSIGAHGAHVF